MNVNVGDFIDNIIDFYSIDKSAEIIENYTLKSVKNYIDKKDSEENLAYFFGSLCFVYSKKELDSKRIRKFIKKLCHFFPYSNINLINHISNFMEMVFLYHTDLINYYLEVIKKLDNLMEEDHMAILYKALALPCYKKYIDYKDIEDKIIYSWRYDYQMSTFNYYYRKYFIALRYVNGALKDCPDFLKSDYFDLKSKICSDIKNEYYLLTKE